MRRRWVAAGSVRQSGASAVRWNKTEHVWPTRAARRPSVTSAYTVTPSTRTATANVSNRVPRATSTRIVAPSNFSACANHTLNNCHPLADCYDMAPGRLLCSCPTGYVGDGRFCERVCDSTGLPPHPGAVNCTSASVCPSGYKCEEQRCCPDLDDPLGLNKRELLAQDA
jgi:hypothetical protein